MGEANQVKQSMRDYFLWPNRNLRSYLERQREGNSDIYETPFYRGVELSEVIDRWMTILQPALERTWPTLLDFETEMRAKAGPMSVQKPLIERMDDILAYYNLSNGETELPDEVITQLIKRWSSVRGLRMRSESNTIANMKMSTNSGSPAFTKRSWAIDKLLPFSITYRGGSDWLLVCPEGKFKITSVLGWRGQEGGPLPEDVKQRVLWMFSMAANIRELQVYQPLIAGMQRTGLISSWLGDDAVDRRITALFDTKRSEDLIICTDFTKFDQHINPGCQRSAQKILNGLFDADGMDYWNNNIYNLKYGIPMCYDVGRFVLGFHGMGSGSGGTNADETVFHSGLQLGAAMNAGAVLNENSMCLGDDGLLTYPGIKTEDVVSFYTQFGQDMNVGKQYESKVDCTYLRRWHHTDYRVKNICVGVYPTVRALTHLRMLERFIDPDKWGVKAVAMRNLSVIENCRYHPLGEEFVQFCMKGDKYRLGLDIPGFLDNLDAEYQRAKANNSLYLSYSAEFGNPKPPSQWWVVQTLKKLA